MKTKLTILFLCLFFKTSLEAGQRFDLQFGSYSFDAQTDRSSGKISSLGYYHANYRRDFSDSIQLGIGYSLIFSKIFSGDTGYGPDLLAYIYPFQKASSIVMDSNQMTLNSFEKFKFFLGGGFHQRQYQSVSSSYAGFSGFTGLEIMNRKDFSYVLQGRYLSLTGPKSATAKEFDFSIGISWFLE